jgi:hypothetical protein
MKIGNRQLTSERGSVTKVTHRAVITILGAVVLGLLSVPAAIACALAPPSASSTTQQLLPDPQNPLALATSEGLARDLSRAASATGASIVGMWRFQYISEGNTTHNPYIADGAQLNFGYKQFHTDGTEIQNSGARSPAQGNFCLGVWQKTGYSTYQLNHFALNYNATTGTWLGTIIVIEKVTVSPGGTAYSGTFVESVFDTNGNKTDQLTGQVTAQQITVDTATP